MKKSKKTRTETQNTIMVNSAVVNAEMGVEENEFEGYEEKEGGEVTLF